MLNYLVAAASAILLVSAPVYVTSAESSSHHFATSSEAISPHALASRPIRFEQLLVELSEVMFKIEQLKALEQAKADEDSAGEDSADPASNDEHFGGEVAEVDSAAMAPDQSGLRYRGKKPDQTPAIEVGSVSRLEADREGEAERQHPTDEKEKHERATKRHDRWNSRSRLSHLMMNDQERLAVNQHRDVLKNQKESKTYDQTERRRTKGPARGAWESVKIRNGLAEEPNRFGLRCKKCRAPLCMSMRIANGADVCQME